MKLRLLIVGLAATCDVVCLRAGDCSKPLNRRAVVLLQDVASAPAEYNKTKATWDAMKALAKSECSMYAPIVASLLHLKFTDPSYQEPTVVVTRTKTPEEMYPAVSVLIAMGPSVRSAVMRAISGGSTEAHRKNALYVLTVVRRDEPQGVLVGEIAKSAADEPDVVKRIRLLDAAKTLAELCHPDYAKQCWDALER